MSLLNAKETCDAAAAQGFGVPARNKNGGSYDIARAAKDKLKEDSKEIIRACGSEDKAGAIQ